MKRIALLAFVVQALIVVAALPASAPAAGCRPLDCAPSGAPLGSGLLAARPQGATGPLNVVDLRTGEIATRLPAGVLAGTTLVHQDHWLLTWYDALTGRQTRTATAQGDTAPTLAGASQDGTRAVLQSTFNRRTTFLVVSPSGQKTVELPGASWGFDALSGNNLFLLHFLPKGYQVRRYDLASGKLIAQPLKDPHESSLIWGTPWSRVDSPDGRYIFTLYVGSNGGTMVHELDLRRLTARCVDLPGTGSFNAATSYAMELSRDGRTLWTVSPGYGRVAAIDVRAARVKVAFRFPHSSLAEAPQASVSALSADGSRLAVAVSGDLWFVHTGDRTVVKAKPHGALALGFAPDGTNLWAVLNDQLVVSLPVA